MTMPYRRLGRTGLTVSALGMGTMTFGAEADEAESRAMIGLCRDAGINLFDCANKYANGRSERILGTALKDCRDEVILTTKAASRVDPGPNSLGASRKHLMLELEKSLNRMQTDYIDLYFIHYFDPATALESTLRFMDDAVRQGKILHIGVSNWAAWQVMKGLHIARLQGLTPIDCIQPMYNLVKRQAEVEVLPLAADQGLGVLTYSPLGAGVLTGKYADLAADASARLHDKDYYHKRYRDEQYFDTASRFLAFAQEEGIDPVPLAIRWAADHPIVTSALLGARNCEQLKRALNAADLNLSPELRGRISRLSPTPAPAHDRLEEILDPATRLRG